MKNKNYKKELQLFADKIKKYQSVCRGMWNTHEYLRDTDEFNKLKNEEAELREWLVLKWGFLEPVFRKLGIETIAVVMNRQFSIFDQGLKENVFNNILKGDALRMAVQSAIKAVGAIDSVDIEEFESEDEEFHQRIKSGKCLRLYNDGHYPEAVENSFKIVRDRLRELTGYETGSDAFGKGNLYIKGASAIHVDEDFQNGVKFLCMSLDRFRNEKAHFADGNISSSKRAKEYLNLSNLLMHLLDEAEVKKKDENKK